MQCEVSCKSRQILRCNEMGLPCSDQCRLLLYHLETSVVCDAGRARSVGPTRLASTIAKPHVIHLDAAPDNEREPLDLPLSPWY